MTQHDFDQDEEQMYAPHDSIQPIVHSLGLSHSPTTLAVLGIALAKSLGYSPFIGGIAGAVLGGVILVIIDQTQSSARLPHRQYAAH